VRSLVLVALLAAGLSACGGEPSWSATARTGAGSECIKYNEIIKWDSEGELDSYVLQYKFSFPQSSAEEGIFEAPLVLTTNEAGSSRLYLTNPEDMARVARCHDFYIPPDQRSGTTPTTKPKPTTTKASSGGSEDYNERLAKCYFDEERPGYDFAGGGQQDDAAMIVCLGRVKE
jgi:hypothetical protein